MNAIEIENLNKYFGELHATKALHLTVQAGECVALAGHNGAGKSTLMKMMLGLLRPDNGLIKVFGHNPESEMAKNLSGYLPEIVSLYPALTGYETLNFFARLKKQDLKQNKALLEKVGIEQAGNRRVGTYSKGMKQRLALAQALLGQPKILFLDEPTTGLDPASRQQFYEIVQELRNQGTGIILSSHALSELVGQVDRIIILKNGEKTADGTIESLRQQTGLKTKIIATFHSENDCPDVLGFQKALSGKLMAECLENEVSLFIEKLYQIKTPNHLSIIPPTLDETYAYFLQREDK